MAGGLTFLGRSADGASFSPEMQAWLTQQAQDVPAAVPPGSSGYVAPTAPAAADPEKVLTPLGRKWAGDITSAVTAPRDAYTGALQVFDPATGHVTDEAMNRANAMAGLAMTGSMPFEAPAGALRMFGGKNAATADHAAMNQARLMDAVGADRKTIWDQTGWFKGADDHWRFEIPDDLSTLGTAAHAPPGYSRLYHDDLAGAYPSMWHNTGQTIRQGPVAQGRYHSWGDFIEAQGPTDQAQRSVALHELQHAVQREEGFAPGGSASDPSFLAYPSVQRAAQNGSKAKQEALFDLYRRQAGEVEARNVQARIDMTPEQRRATPPWETQDVPDELQIVRFGQGPASSLPFLGR